MEYKFKTELHAHTTPASACSQIHPEYLIESYKERGYSSVCLTNHLICDTAEPQKKIEKYLDDYYKTLELGKQAGINVILGSEIRFSENTNDYLLFGISPDDLLYVNSLLDNGIEAFYKTFKNDKNIIIQAHPFRDYSEPANPEYLDGIEVFNVHPGHNSRIAFAARFAKENNMIVTSGTDFHHYGHEGLCGILTKNPITDSYCLAEILKSRDYLIDIGGYKIMP